MKYVWGEASDFYFACSDGRIDRVQQMLDAEDAPSIDELNRLQANCSTPLHAATFNNHLDIVRLLLDRNCCRTTLNRYENTRNETVIPTMQSYRPFP
jgi:ankyrin repeat protein